MRTESILKEIQRQIEELRSLVTKANRPFLSLEEAAEYLDLAKETIYQFSSQGILPKYKLHGRRIYFKKSDLDDFILNEKNRKRSKAEIETKAATELVTKQRGRK